MKRNRTIQGVIGALLLGTSGIAMAHPGGSETSSFMTGLLHPLLGLDHLLAMLAVGVWAAQRGGAARWQAPLAFVSVMLLGSVLATNSLVVAGAEQVIAASVLVLGLLMTGALRLALPAGITLIAAFGLFHGHAHGVEMPTGASVVGYGAGFLIATAALHGVGVWLGQTLLARCGQGWLRGAGALTAGAGAALLLGF